MGDLPNAKHLTRDVFKSPQILCLLRNFRKLCFSVMSTQQMTGVGTGVIVYHRV